MPALTEPDEGAGRAMAEGALAPVEDLLSAVLNAHHLKAGIHARLTLRGDWRFGASGDGHASFHLVAEGAAYLHAAAGDPVVVRSGDVIVLPHDGWHMLASSAELPDCEQRLTRTGAGAPASFLCGYFDFCSSRHNPVLQALPERILIRSGEADCGLEHLAKLMMLEAANAAPAQEPVLERLADTLFVMVVRHYVFNQCSEPERRGLVAGLADPRLRRALDAIHRAPEADWTLERLASAASMSRSVFALRFAAAVGDTPIDYLTRWRMVQAERMLRDGCETVASVTEKSGYQTEAAFRKAFKRVHGYGPGKVRRASGALRFVSRSPAGSRVPTPRAPDRSR